MERLWERLKYKKPLRLNNYDILYQEGNTYQPETHFQLQLNNLSYQENYNLFLKNITSSIGEKYLPVYRMADGEFIFTRSLNNELTLNNILLKLGIKKLKTCWGESYTNSEISKIKLKYINDLNLISSSGYLALHFIDTTEIHHEYYPMFEKIANWFEVNSIKLDESNYTSFYYIYVLLNGKDSSLVFNKRNILIITSYDEEKKINISDFLLKQKGARSVQFYNISSNKAMTEKIDLHLIKKPIDLVLIGAGIGSSNILVQCSELKTVCIDAGIVIECFANPELFKSRIFLMPTDDIENYSINS
jgi:hypothetical protein